MVGALIESVPEVSVKDAGVEAPAGTTMQMLKALSVAPRRTIFVPSVCPISRIESEATLWHPWAAMSDLESGLDPIDMGKFNTPFSNR